MRDATDIPMSALGDELTAMPLAEVLRVFRGIEPLGVGGLAHGLAHSPSVRAQPGARPSTPMRHPPDATTSAGARSRATYATRPGSPTRVRNGGSTVGSPPNGHDRGECSITGGCADRGDAEPDPRGTSIRARDRWAVVDRGNRLAGDVQSKRARALTQSRCLLHRRRTRSPSPPPRPEPSRALADTGTGPSRCAPVQCPAVRRTRCRSSV